MFNNDRFVFTIHAAQRILLGIAQIGILFVLSIFGTALRTSLHIPIPGSIIGLVVLFLLLQTRAVRLKWVELGATWLIAELLLLFIPSAVGVVEYSRFIATEGLQTVCVILLSTVTVMIVTGGMTELLVRRQMGKKV